MASGRRGRWRYTCPVTVFARRKSKNAASPDEERSSALSRFLLQVKHNNTRQSRTASSCEFTACSGTPHPLLVRHACCKTQATTAPGSRCSCQVGGSVGGSMALMLRLQAAGRSQVRYSRQPSARSSAHVELSPAAVTLFAVGQIVRSHPQAGSVTPFAVAKTPPAACQKKP